MSLQISAGSAVRGIIPTDFDQAVRFAKMAVHAGMFKSKDGDIDQALAQATMAVLQGLELGIPPMQAVQQIAIINGRCCVWGDLIPALIWRAGHKIKEWIEGDGDARVAWCEIKRCDNDEPVKRKFSVDDAKKAGLWDTDATVKRWNKWKKDKNGNSAAGYEDKPNDSPWFKYPDRMLQMRARGFCARDAVPDVLRGLYVREELEDVNRFREERDITPTVDQVETLPTRKDVPKLSAPVPAKTGNGFLLSFETQEMENVPANEVKSRCLGFINGNETNPELLKEWRDRNRVVLRQFWGVSKSEALAINGALGKVLETANQSEAA